MRRRSLRNRSVVSASVGLLAMALALPAGCASLIGAEFDGAKLAADAAEGDADIFDGSGGPDVISGDGAPPIDAGDAAFDFDAKAAGDGNVVLWVAADRGIVDGGFLEGGNVPTVAGWTDQSGLKHDLVPPSVPQRPLLVTLDSGLPVVKLERARISYFVSPNWGGPAGKRGTTIFIVTRGEPDSLVRFQGPSTPSHHVIFPWNSRYGSPTDPPDYHFYVAAGADIQRLRTGIVTTEWNIATAVLELGVVAGMRAYRNGLLIEQGSIFADAMPAADTLTLGCTYAATECAETEVAEILIYGSPLPDPERAYVETYLKKKWAL